MYDANEHQRGVVITTSDHYAFSQEYFDIIEKNIKTNPNLEVMSFCTDLSHFNVSNEIDKRENFFQYRLLFSIELAKLKKKHKTPKAITESIIKEVFKKYKKYLVIH